MKKAKDLPGIADPPVPAVTPITPGGPPPDVLPGPGRGWPPPGEGADELHGPCHPAAPEPELPPPEDRAFGVPPANPVGELNPPPAANPAVGPVVRTTPPSRLLVFFGAGDPAEYGPLAVLTVRRPDPAGGVREVRVGAFDLRAGDVVCHGETWRSIDRVQPE